MTDRERHEDETLKNCIQEAYGCSDDQLLAELAEIDKTLSESDLPGVEDRIMSRLKARMAEEETEKKIEVNPEADKVSVAQVEESESETTTEVETAPCVEVQEKKVVRIGKKKIALVAVLAAAFVGVLGGSAVGGKIYLLKGREKDKGIVLNSGRNIQQYGELKDAYDIVEKELDIPVLKLNYIPAEMKFKDVSITEDGAIFVFEYNENKVYFIQKYRSKETSIGMNSDRNSSGITVENIWISKNIELSENNLDNGNIEFSALLYMEEASYRIIGVFPEEEIMKIVENLNF